MTTRPLAFMAASPAGGLPPYEPDADRVAYLLFTSGSTGRPKGVPIRHRNVLVGRRLTHWFSVPSVVSVGAELGGLPAEPVPGLRYSLFAGEQLTYGQAGVWHAIAVGGAKV
jgi:acyl-CoA synthetase (AMP-forming)/AMP-acid ligase II